VIPSPSPSPSRENYALDDDHSDTVEGYFSVFKRGITGVYHHVGEAHLKPYLAEFDLRYNERIALGVNDAKRASTAVFSIAGKRLLYQYANGSDHA
jgi:hypothetical protein